MHFTVKKSFNYIFNSNKIMSMYVSTKFVYNIFDLLVFGPTAGELSPPWHVTYLVWLLMLFNILFNLKNIFKYLLFFPQLLQILNI